MDAHDITTWIVTNFTDDKHRLNWDAFSAIGTVLAVWFVAIQWSNQGRANRARDIGLLTYAIGLLEPIAETPTDPDYHLGMGAEELEGTIRIIDRAVEGMSQFPLTEAYAVGIVEWTTALQLSLRTLQNRIGTGVERDYLSMVPALEYVGEAVSFFRAMREHRRFNAVYRFLRRYIFRVTPEGV